VRNRTLIVVLFVILGLLAGWGCRKAPPRTNEVVAVPTTEVPLDPNDSAWERAHEHLAKLILQDLVEPRLMKPSTPEVRVRAVTNGSDIAFRLQWLDPNKSDLPGPGRFVDACAVQLPQKIERDPPDPQMGQVGRTVEITFWRADWQASVDGRGDTIQAIYPNATVDHYPFQAPSLEAGSNAQKQMAKRYAPAEAVGNLRGGPRESPVEDMVAEGPGTLTPATRTISKGKGLRTKDGWMVVLSRPVPGGHVPRARTQIALAVWEGSHGEVGARKMRTGWIPLLMQGEK
jgi:DMSO reductase family type II enzyme heme b subunit